MKKILNTVVKKRYAECVKDGVLSIPELGCKFVAGYCSSWNAKKKKHIEVESRVNERTTYGCARSVKGCRGKFIGYDYGGFPRQGPWALYRCRHGIDTFGLIEKHWDFKGQQSYRI